MNNIFLSSSTFHSSVLFLGPLECAIRSWNWWEKYFFTIKKIQFLAFKCISKFQMTHNMEWKNDEMVYGVLHVHLEWFIHGIYLREKILGLFWSICIKNFNLWPCHTFFCTHIRINSNLWSAWYCIKILRINFSLKIQFWDFKWCFKHFRDITVRKWRHSKLYKLIFQKLLTENIHFDVSVNFVKR